MLDLNRLFLFIAFLSPAVVLARTWRRSSANHGWRLAAIAVLLVTALAWIAAARVAGYIGGGAWFALLFLPAIGLRKAEALAQEERFAAARRIVAGLRFLHPLPSVRAESLVLRALELAQSGHDRAAENLLAQIAPNESRAGRRARAQSFRIRGDWEGLAEWGRQNLPRVGLGEDPALLLLYFRALGETNRRDELVLQFAGRAAALRNSPIHQPIYATGLMLLLAFGGRTGALQYLLQTSLRGLRADSKEFWIATSALIAGQSDAAARLWHLRDVTTDQLIRRDIERRGASFTRPTPLLRPAEETIDRFERGTEQQRGSLLPLQGARVTPAVLVFIALNVAMFLCEVALGGSSNTLTLYRLGALDPWAVLAAHQYWRLFASLFLHYGAIHLIFNLYALYILGPTLEQAMGTLRFAISYLLAGLGSSLGVVLLWRFGLTKADFLVGASGCVMGIVGAWAGLLLRHRHSLMARRRLTNIALIVVMQTAFDFYTPQVSMAAHMSGLVSGLLVGLLIAPRLEHF